MFQNLELHPGVQSGNKKDVHVYHNTFVSFLAPSAASGQFVCFIKETDHEKLDGLEFRNNIVARDFVETAVGLFGITDDPDPNSVIEDYMTISHNVYWYPGNNNPPGQQGTDKFPGDPEFNTEIVMVAGVARSVGYSVYYELGGVGSGSAVNLGLNPNYLDEDFSWMHDQPTTRILARLKTRRSAALAGRQKMKFVVGLVFFCMAASLSAETITFQAEGQSFDIEFVEIGAPGNPADFDDRYPGDEKFLGAVGYVYSVSKFEASCEGINIFRDLGAVCRGRDTYPFGTSQATTIEYVNWLNEIQGHPHAYNDPTFDETGNVIPDLVRNPQARFFITSADEWHKAAYYDPVDEVYYDYATGSDTRPISVAEGTEPGTAVLQAFTGIAPVELAGGPSPFGTVGQTGNIHEIEESLRWFRWGINSFGSAQAHLARVSAEELTGGVGFRIVAIPPVPEPSSNFLATLGCLATLLMLRHSPRTRVRS